MDFIALALTLAGFSLMLILISYQRHRHGRDLSAWLHGIVGAIIGIAGALVFEAALNLSTYQEIPDSNVPIAELSVTQRQTMYEISLMRIPSGELQVFTVSEPRWRMRVRMLRGRGILTQLGLQPRLRLEQLQSSLEPDSSGVIASPTAYTLSHDSGLHLAALSRRTLKRWLVSTIMVSEPMTFSDGDRYQLFQQSGLLITRRIERTRPVATRQPPVAPSLNQKAITLLKGSDLSVNSPPAANATDSAMPAATHAPGATPAAVH